MPGALVHMGAAGQEYGGEKEQDIAAQDIYVVMKPDSPVMAYPNLADGSPSLTLAAGIFIGGHASSGLVRVHFADLNQDQDLDADRIVSARRAGPDGPDIFRSAHATNTETNIACGCKKKPLAEWSKLGAAGKSCTSAFCCNPFGDALEWCDVEDPEGSGCSKYCAPRPP
eukprot:gnl/MRDRNA2_/MRDRNA2_204072_c0_seq1.p1 gnl/MRDRNA2_/MRDRNA2_204072_c0~~gnl/MRDRNA2_/MRDRNA2_204072_c0_seq1.p1  ORF type:complete len:170 (+),score=28.12 gnl/MRDRNA2_/MRDRNA2_204072_c0_seq1:35-544(+)